MVDVRCFHQGLRGRDAEHTTSNVQRSTSKEARLSTLVSLSETVPHDRTRPTNIRSRIIGVTMLVAFILYLDRICMSEIVKSVSFHADPGLSKMQTGRILGAFFFAYALFQVPAGWASDRFGTRPMLTIYIVLWSLFTVLTGLASGFAGLLAARLLCGMAEAGAYPTAMALIRKWIPLTGRARASSMFALGGGGGQGGGLDPHVGCGVASEAHAPLSEGVSEVL